MYGFDDLTGGLHLSHRLVLSSKDYPGIPHELQLTCLAGWCYGLFIISDIPVGFLKIFKGNDCPVSGT